MASIYNFSAGPSLLPREVMEQVQAEFLDWHSTGLSVMEMSHRSAAYESIIHSAEADLRKLLAIPEEYAVLFMQGGGAGQFDAIPLNLRPEGKSADYVITGDWSKKAYTIASNTGHAHTALSNASSHYYDLPNRAEGHFNRDAAYLHFCSNETISGVELPDLPDLPTDVPWVADMSSNILSRPISIARYGLIYASAQKNIGPAGFSVVIVRRDLLNKALPITPAILNYTILAKNGSMYNTPPTFAIYVAGLVFQWLLRQGGLVAIEHKNKEKAQLVYDTIDASSLFRCPIAPAARSTMNIPFTSGNADIDARFLNFVESRKLVQLKGHKSVGGMRASLYNAMPIEGVHALTKALRDFEKSADF